MLYLDGHIWINICSGPIFCRWYQRATPHWLSISPAFASSGCDIDPIVDDFRRYALSSVVIEYYKRILMGSDIPHRRLANLI